MILSVEGNGPPLGRPLTLRALTIGRSIVTKYGFIYDVYSDFLFHFFFL